MENIMSKKVFLSCLAVIVSIPLIAEEYFSTGDPVALTPPGEFYMAARWSPNSEQLAASGRSYNHLYLVEFPTGQATQLSDAFSAGYGFAWSHDGSQIAARTARYQNMRRLNTLVSFDVADGSMKTILEARSKMPGRPTWSRDDAQIYLSFSDKMESYDLVGKRQSPGRFEGVTVEDGKLIIYTAGKAMGQALFKDLDRVTSYALSPDENHIAFSTSGQNLWMTDIAGQNRISLGKGITPSWSPDSQWITFMLTEDDGHTMLNSDVYIMRLDGKQRTNITATLERIEMNPQWSPDGSWIVYDTEFQGQLFVQQMGRR
jgi:Tol biopolymer transport system component